MKTQKALCALAGLAMAAVVLAPMPSMAQNSGRTKIGTLTCDISAGIGVIIARSIVQETVAARAAVLFRTV